MAYIVMAYIVMAYVGMAHIVMAYIVMAYILTAYILTDNIAIAHIVMPHIGYGLYSYGLYRYGLGVRLHDLVVHLPEPLRVEVAVPRVPQTLRLVEDPARHVAARRGSLCARDLRLAMTNMLP